RVVGNLARGGQAQRRTQDQRRLDRFFLAVAQDGQFDGPIRRVVNDEPCERFAAVYLLAVVREDNVIALKVRLRRGRIRQHLRHADALTPRDLLQFLVLSVGDGGEENAEVGALVLVVRPRRVSRLGMTERNRRGGQQSPQQHREPYSVW